MATGSQVVCCSAHLFDHLLGQWQRVNLCSGNHCDSDIRHATDGRVTRQRHELRTAQCAGCFDNDLLCGKWDTYIGQRLSFCLPLSIDLSPSLIVEPRLVILNPTRRVRHLPISRANSPWSVYVFLLGFW